MFEFTSIEQFHAQLQEGKVTCLQVVQYYLEQIHSTRHLNAFIEVYADEALQRAKLLDEIGKDHLLAINGEDALVIFTVDTLGLTTGSHLLIYHQAPVQVDSRELGFWIFFGTGA